MTDDELYEQIFIDLKTYLLEASEYSPTISKAIPNEMNISPLIVMDRPESIFSDENLKKGDLKLKYTFEVNIYTKDKTKSSQLVNKNVIGMELRELVDKVMFEDYGMSRITDRTIPNLDANILRIFLRYECLFDKERAIIFRR